MPWLVPLIAIVLALRMAWFMDAYTVNVFNWDQWDFLRGFFTDADLWTLFRQEHGPHRQGLAAPLLKLVYSLSHFSSRAEAFVTLAVLLLAGLSMLALKRRLFGARVYDVGILFLYMTLQSYDVLVLTPNPAHGPLPLLLVSLIGWAFLIPVSAWRTLTLTLLAFLAMHTGFAMFAALLIPAVSVVDAVRAEKRFWPVVTTVASTLALGTFFLQHVSDPAMACYRFPDPRPYLYFAFSGLMITHVFFALKINLFTSVVGVSVGLLASGFVAFSGWRFLREGSEKWRTIFFLGGFSVLFSLASAVGRVCAGLGGALPSRYALYSVPLLVAVYLVLHFLQRPRVYQLVWLLAVILKEADIREPLAMADELTQQKRRFVECYLRTENLKACEPTTSAWIYPDPPVTHLQEKLQYLKAHKASLFRLP